MDQAIGFADGFGGAGTRQGPLRRFLRRFIHFFSYHLFLKRQSIRQVKAAWVAGCDGSRSPVREMSGITFPGAPYEHVFFVADVDMNLVALESGRLVEVQGTGENDSFSREQLDRLLDLGMAGIERLHALQRDALVQPG